MTGSTPITPQAAKAYIDNKIPDIAIAAVNKLIIETVAQHSSLTFRLTQQQVAGTVSEMSYKQLGRVPPDPDSYDIAAFYGHFGWQVDKVDQPDEKTAEPFYQFRPKHPSAHFVPKD